MYLNWIIIMEKSDPLFDERQKQSIFQLQDPIAAFIQVHLFLTTYTNPHHVVTLYTHPC